MSNVVVSGKVVKVSTVATKDSAVIVTFKVVTENVDETTGEVKPVFTPFSVYYRDAVRGEKFAKILSRVFAATVEATKTVLTQGTKNPDVVFAANYTDAKHIKFEEYKHKQA